MFIVVFCLPTFILTFDFANFDFNPTKDIYLFSISAILFLLVFIYFLDMLFKFFTPKNKLKIGLDIHGICDASPEYFAELTRLFVNAGHEVHLITGRRVSDGAIKEIKSLGLYYTHFFSIADYHKEIGTKVWEDDDGNPWLEGDLWDRTKGDYCKKHNIDFHIDDTERYGQYFETPFMLSKISKRAK